MAVKSQRVMDMVRREIQKNPAVGSQELFDKAKKMDGSMNSLNIRQFHAGYPLQVKRLLKPTPKGAAVKTPARRGPGRPRKIPAAPAVTAAAKTPVRRRRRRAPATPTAGAAAPARAGRDTVRSILIKFAGEVAAADGKADVVQVIGGMDRYVDQVLRAASA